jgi:putative aldouronate transport system substrate-binding protein
MTLKNQDAETKANKIVGGIGGNWKPGGLAEVSAKNGYEVVGAPISPTIIKTAGITATINSIVASSKNPERAMMLIELVNSDKELFNLLSFGFENEHYKKIDDNTIEVVKDTKYSALNWVFGNVFNGYLVKGQEKDTWEQTKEMNKNGKPSVALGFSFDAAPVKTELAQCQTVIDEYLPGLGCGASDISKKLPEFIQKLKAAGADAIITETQKQLDAWKTSK